MPSSWSRRGFLAAAAAAVPAGWSLSGPPPFRLGVTTHLDRDPDAALEKVRNLGFPTCFVNIGEVNPEVAGPFQEALRRYGLEATALESLGPGKFVWDFVSGPQTIGLVPPATRAARVAHLQKASDFARRAGIPHLQTHCGFIPETPDDPLYAGTVEAIRAVTARCRENGQMFLMETGQETPVAVLRVIQDVGLDNLGVGLDTANLILYGKANPLDSLDVFGKYVRSVHAKDGLYPTDPRRLGREVPIGEGKVDFLRIIRRLRELDYAGAITIEREISGPRQIEDIRKAKSYLEKIVAQTARP